MLEEDKGCREKEQRVHCKGKQASWGDADTLILNSVVKYFMLRGEKGLSGVAMQIPGVRISQMEKKSQCKCSKSRAWSIRRNMAAKSLKIY